MFTQLLVVLWAQSVRVDSVTIDANVAAQRVSLISAEILRERPQLGLADALREEVGVETQRTASFMGGIFIRGLTGNKVVVYRDGIRYSTSAGRGGVSTFFNLLDSGGLEEAEILRGPNSSQYGSDSLGGVLHVISRRPLPNGGRAEFTPFCSSAAHAFGEGATWVNRYFVLRGMGQRVNTLRTGKGLDSRSALTRFLGLPSNIYYTRQPDSAFTQYGASAHVAIRGFTLHLDRNQQDGAKRTDQLLGGDGARLARVDNIMTDFAYLRYNREKVAHMDWISAAVSYNAQREERVNQASLNATAQRQYERLRAWGVQGQAAKRVWTQDWTVGSEVYTEEMRSPAQNTLPRIRHGAGFQHYGAYVENRTELGGGLLRLSGGLRWGGGRFSLPGLPGVASNAWSGRVGGVVRVSGWMQMHGYLSRGFRAPSMTDLGAQGLQGNGTFEALPFGLRPEFSDNVDLGFRLRGKGMHFESTVFRSAIRNLIVARTLLLPQGSVGELISGERITTQRSDGAVFVAISTQPVQVRANQDRGIFRGIEQRFEAKLSSSWLLSEGFTWLRADDPNSGGVPNLEGAYPPPMGYLRIRYNPPGKRLWIEPYWTGNGRLNRLSELARNDRRIGASRTRAQITNFYNNHPELAALTGLPLSGVLLQVPPGPLYSALPGYGLLGLRGGYSFTERLSIFADLSNLADKSHRGMSWGVDGAGRGVSLQLRWNY